MSLNPQIVHLNAMPKMEYELRYRENSSFTQWKTQTRNKLAELLGYPFEKPNADNLKIEWTDTKASDYNEIRFTFDSEVDCTVVCHLLLPKNILKPIPAIICLQGHSKGMHISLGRAKYPGDQETISGGDRDFARQVIRKGYAALTIEQRGFGERGGTSEGPACYQVAMQALLLGRTLIGERCWDISRTIDIIEKYFPQIDAGRIGVMGNSGGGTVTLYAAAMDERISAAMPSCAFCGYQESIGELYHCSCNYVPGIMKYMDMGDIAGLIAPRALIIVNGKEDNIFPLHSAIEQMNVAQMCYNSAGAQSKLRHVIGPEGHRFYADLSWPVFDEVTEWIK